MRYDVSKHNLERIITLPTQEVQQFYEEGMTIAEIASRFSVSVGPVKKTLRSLGAKMRPAAPRLGVGAGSGNPAWRGGRYVRPDGYVMVWTPGGDKLEHRVLMERHINRRLLPREVVHHRDGNPSNNNLSNLELLPSQSIHSRNHRAVNRATLIIHGLKECTQCHIIKPLTQFYPARHNRMGIHSWCKACKNLKNIEYRKRAASPARHGR